MTPNEPTDQVLSPLVEIPTADDIAANLERIAPYIRTTPTWQWKGPTVEETLGPKGEVFLKLELFQHAGSFKTRGALSVMLGLDQKALDRGVTGVSAGNHAIAVAYAAKILGCSAKVVMLESANPARVERCRGFGAEVVMAPDGHKGFEIARELEASEGRTLVHPFEGPLTTLGAAGVGYEFCRQVEGLDAVIVPIGGGGLMSGVSAAVKRTNPSCRVIGVEPEGADTMHRSFVSRKPESLDKIRTIADSLGAPYSAPYSLGVCLACVDELVKVDDDMICRAMARMFAELKLAVEPAAAAAASALLGPLGERLRGRRVGLIVCGANIDVDTFRDLILRGQRV